MMQYYPQVDEHLFTRRLSNGLTVKVLPKKGFQRKLAYFCTNFGAIHRHFRLDGQEYRVPAGVAHFLEHKMFELPDRDVSAEFAALGGNVNAFTSFDMTAYYFSCTANFEENLQLLLTFVSTAYFPEESVQREMGIIDQEIAMYRDDPSSREFEGLMDVMYRHHPVRTPILGTHQSIRQITSQVLYDCHRAFYTPANMILCVVGDVDAEQICAIAEGVLGREYRPAGEKLPTPPEEMRTCGDAPTLHMDVANQTFQLGFKCPPAQKGEQALRTDVTGYLAAEMLLGESTQLYLDLYEQRIIGSSFGGGFETIDGCAMLTCGGDSDEPEQVRRALLDRAAGIVRDGIDETEFLRLKRGAMGRRIRDLDSFDAICFRLCAYHFLDYDYLCFPGVYAAVTAEEVRRFIEENITSWRSSMIITRPSGQNQREIHSLEEENI